MRQRLIADPRSGMCFPTERSEVANTAGFVRVAKYLPLGIKHNQMLHRRTEPPFFPSGRDLQSYKALRKWKRWADGAQSRRRLFLALPVHLGGSVLPG